MSKVRKDNLASEGLFDHDAVIITSGKDSLRRLLKILSVNLAGFTKWDDSILRMNLLPKESDK